MQNCLILIKKLIFYILQFELKKLVKNCGFSPQIPKDSVFDKNCKNDTNTLYYTHDYIRHVFILVKLMSIISLKTTVSKKYSLHSRLVQCFSTLNISVRNKKVNFCSVCNRDN